MPNLSPEELLQLQTVEESLFVWMAVHGYLCLGLRHPGAQGSSRAYVEDFARKLGRILVERGILTGAELAEAERLEHIERARQRN
jgi:hypothetical protein